jgi:arylsulfatase A-like enzyme
VKIPMIIYDPRAGANATRGTTCDALIEAIDLAPTFVDAAGGTIADHILEGRSLQPWLHGETPEWRAVCISEYDYSSTPMRDVVGVSNRDARLFMVFDGRFKLIHAEGGFRPILFDLETDPNEFIDLAKGEAHSDDIARLYDHLARWGRRMSQRVTMSDANIDASRGLSGRRGILPFMKDGSEVPEELTEVYRGAIKQTFVPDQPKRDS